MKTVIINTTLQLNDDTPDISTLGDVLRNALKPFGLIQLPSNFPACSQIDYHSADNLTRRLWILLPEEGETPDYFTSTSHSLTLRDTQQILPTDVPRIMSQGVCVGMFTYLPNVAKYGLPDFANNDTLAAAYVASRKFKVEPMFTSDIEDMGDDGGEAIWLEIALPESFTFSVISEVTPEPRN